MLYGVMMGEQKMAEKKDIRVTLEDVTLRSPMSEVAALIAFRGRLELRSVIFDGARYGLYLDGKALGVRHCQRARSRGDRHGNPLQESNRFWHGRPR